MFLNVLLGGRNLLEDNDSQPEEKAQKQSKVLSIAQDSICS